MRTLYHYPLDVFGRIVRICLNEKGLEYQSIEELPWSRKKIFADKHMFSDLPTLVDNDGMILESAYAIIEHIDQVYRSKASLLGTSMQIKSEVRRISALFNVSFFAEVTNNVVFEKVIKKYTEKSSPNSSFIRKGNESMKKYFDYITWLINGRNWLAGNEFSLADISAAAHISCLDYLESVKWEDNAEVKDWYVRIKSRPSFQDILNDRISDLPPSPLYTELDF